MEKLSAIPSPDVDLVQESTVEIGDREVRVVSRVLIDPEVLVVNEVYAGERVLKKRHTPAPAVTVRQYEERGAIALAPYLLSSHLRFVRRLLTANNAQGDAPSDTQSQRIPAGVVATMVLGAGGEVLASAGEDHVPSGWLRAPYLIEAVIERAEASFDWGRVQTVSVVGDGVSARMHRGEAQTAVSFLQEERIPEEQEAAIRRHLEEVACGAR